jgi:2-methylcitrate synthase
MCIGFGKSDATRMVNCMQLDIIGASNGPLHGGANEAVMHTFDEIGSAHRQPSAWLEEALASKCKIMGFGHGVYMDGDS